MGKRIVIEVPNYAEARRIKSKIAHLTSYVWASENSLSFIPNDGVDLLELAKLLDTGKRSEPVTPGNTPRSDIDSYVITHQPKSVACNLATHIAWLEGFSVVSECTGANYCEILNPNRSTVERLKYDPIGRGGLLLGLIKKYEVDVDWREDGDFEVRIYDWAKGGSMKAAVTGSHNNSCFATCVMKVILESQK